MVVEDEVDIELGRRLAVDEQQEGEELVVAMGA